MTQSDARKIKHKSRCFALSVATVCLAILADILGKKISTQAMITHAHGEAVADIIYSARSAYISSYVLAILSALLWYGAYRRQERYSPALLLILFGVYIVLQFVAV